MRTSRTPSSPNVIGGSAAASSVDAGVRESATIAGGGVRGPGERARLRRRRAAQPRLDVYGTVGGGMANLAGNDAGTWLPPGRPWRESNYNRATRLRSAAVGNGHGVNLASGDSNNIPRRLQQRGNAAPCVDRRRPRYRHGLHQPRCRRPRRVEAGRQRASSRSGSNVARAPTTAPPPATARSQTSGAAWCSPAEGEEPGVRGFEVVSARRTSRASLLRTACPWTSVAASWRQDTQWVTVGDLVPGQTIATWTGAYCPAAVWNNASDHSLKDRFAAGSAWTRRPCWKA